MLIEIRNVGFVNKGAELMLHAIIGAVSGELPNAAFVMAPEKTLRPYSKRAELKLLQKAWYWRFGFQWGCLARFIPRRLLEMYGIVREEDLDMVLDASGFCYSDQFAPQRSIEMACSCKRWKKNGTKVILLPQAFGPFENRKTRDAIRVVADCADLIFARDEISLKYLTDAVGERKNIQMAPDFTNLLSGIEPQGFESEKNSFCIIPNCRMMDKTSPEIAGAYLPFLITCAKHLLERDQKPFLLVHEGEADYRLAQNVSEALNGRLPIIREEDPRRIKGILGSCKGTLGSRYHGLISALSQGVPALATGWSHKYGLLFREYGFEQGLVDLTLPEENIKQKLDLLVETQSRQSIINSILAKSLELKNRSREMWRMVFNRLLTKNS